MMPSQPPSTLLDSDGTEEGMIDGSLELDGINKGKFNGLLERTLFWLQNLVLALIQNFNDKVSIKCSSLLYVLDT
jgi:hypothetical protein